jgi:hypothetical protein
MRPHATRLLMSAVYATMVMTVPLVTATDSGAASHVGKHHKPTNPQFRNSWAAETIRPVAPSSYRGGEVCPGNGRSFECKIWPPPMSEDPDRRNGDGGP